ncbi:MAG: GTP cyclohydrolase II [Sphingomicrobium sp.]
MKPTAVERAIAAFRGGRPVRIGQQAYLAVETATAAVLDLLDPEGAATLILSGVRAGSLSLSNALHAAAPMSPVSIAREAWLDVESARTLADPGQDYDRAPSGPPSILPLHFPTDAAAALDLARKAGLLPAVWWVGTQEVAIELDAAALETSVPDVMMTARARLPIEGVPTSQIVVFRAADDGQEHVALVVGAFGGAPPLVRLHSECLTGDVFGSLKCDCGPQLKEALRLIGGAGGGILLYLRQEGRGIGLANKIRAYALQDRGVDTVDANTRLGFEDDARDYGAAAAMLRALGAPRVRLLTNNVAKLAGLSSAGIEVVERVAHHMPANPHNADYLATKHLKSGHLA